MTEDMMEEVEEAEPRLIYKIGDYNVEKANRSYCYLRDKDRKVICFDKYISNIADSAFRDFKELEQVCFPENVVEIGVDAFKGCVNLFNVLLPLGLKMIRASAFEGCKSLMALVIPCCVDFISFHAFKDSGLEEIVISSNNIEINTEAFEGCNLKKIYWNGRNYSEVEKFIEDYYFYSDNELIAEEANIVMKYYMRGYTKVTIPHYIKIISNLAFAYCSMKEVIFKKGLLAIQSYAFEYCSRIKKIIIPDSVEYIGDSAFWGCSRLKDVILPKNLRAISQATFTGCSALEKIKIPDGVEEIESFAFCHCDNLKEVYLPANLKKIDCAAFTSCKNLSKFYYKGVCYTDKEQFNTLITGLGFCSVNVWQ